MIHYLYGTLKSQDTEALLLQVDCVDKLQVLRYHLRRVQYDNV